MSDVQDFNKPHALTSDHTDTTAAETPSSQAEAPKADGLAAEERTPEVNGVTDAAKDTVAAPSEEKNATSPAAAAEKSTEPITEGQLGYKGPGLLKSLVPSKKEFWLSDSPVTPQHMDMYMRGEKPETSNAVVAWASQTGRGLLFFNKKGDTSRTHPASVLPLYDAVDLKKSQPHDITFNVAGHPHTLKAASSVERDGWYVSLERAMEMGKADKESIRSGEGYKAEMEKLNKPNTMSSGVAGAAAAARSRSQPKKSVEADKLDESKRTGSEQDEEAAKANQKSRSTSRGMLNRLKAKKDEVEAKREEKKEEKKEEKEEKKIDKEEVKEEKKINNEEAKEEKQLEKEEKKAEKHGEAAPASGAAAALDAPTTAERAVGAPVEENPEATSEPTAPVRPKIEEQSKSKRSSIFGRMQSGWGSMKSPSKEKAEKDAELKPDVPPKDTVVSDTAPQLPEPTSTEPATEAAAAPAIETTEPEHESKPADAVAEPSEAVSPKEKGGFLSNWLGKRTRSVSPSANVKEAPVKKDEAPVVPPKDEPAVGEPAATVDEPTKPATEATTPIDNADKLADEPVKTDVTSPSATNNNKRQSVIGSLGRRASKAFKGFNTPARKENAAPTTNVAEEATPEATDAKPLVNGESNKAPENISAEPQHHQQPNGLGGGEDLRPDSSNIGQAQTTPTVAASA